MYDNNFVLNPKQIYADLDFNKIKNNLKNMYGEYQDYGSIIVLQNPKFFISVNNIGKLQVFYNSIEKQIINKMIKNIECEFNKQVSDFKILNI